MAEIYDLDNTAANNNSAPPDGYPEGMNYQLVNDTGREQMAVLARYINSTGAIVTTGTNNDYLLTVPQTVTAYSTGMRFTMKLDRASIAGACTLKVNTAPTVAIVNNDGTALSTAGDLANGAILSVMYDGTNFVMVSPNSNSITQAEGNNHYIRLDGTNTVTALINFPQGVTVATSATFEDSTTIEDTFNLRGSLNNSPATETNQDALITLQNNGGTLIGRMGFNTTGDLLLQNVVTSGAIELNARASSGDQRVVISADVASGVVLRHNNVDALKTAVTGAIAVDAGTNALGGNQAAKLGLENANSVDLGGVGFFGTPALEIRTNNTDTIILGSSTRDVIDANPDSSTGRVLLKHPVGDSNALQTTTQAAGGVLINNGATGDGTAERPLTVSDAPQIRRLTLAVAAAADGTHDIIGSGSSEFSFPLEANQDYHFKMIGHFNKTGGAGNAILGLGVYYTGSNNGGYWSAYNSDAGFSENRNSIPTGLAPVMLATGNATAGGIRRRAVVEGYISTTGTAGDLVFIFGSTNNVPGANVNIDAGAYAMVEVANILN